MDKNTLTVKLDNPAESLLLPANASKDDAHRLRRFIGWLNDTGRNWHTPDLADYRDYLLNDYQGRNGSPLAPSSVRVHLATIRGRYLMLLRDNTILDAFEYAAASQLDVQGQDVNPANVQALVNRMLRRLENDIDPNRAYVKVPIRQDRPDSDHLRLTPEQANELMRAPGTDTLFGLRNTALVALMLCTGIREQELCSLDVPDLRRRLGGTLAIHIRRGKGARERLVPYGALSWALEIVDAWLQSAGIESGAVFRGFYRNATSVRPNRLHVRAVNQILDRYEIMVDGEKRAVKPHDLRRSYARRLYEAGIDLLSIRDNLGHADSKTTLTYIGTMDADARKPPAVFDFDIGNL